MGKIDITKMKCPCCETKGSFIRCRMGYTSAVGITTKDLRFGDGRYERSYSFTADYSYMCTECGHVAMFVNTNDTDFEEMKRNAALDKQFIKDRGVFVGSFQSIAKDNPREIPEIKKIEETGYEYIIIEPTIDVCTGDKKTAVNVYVCPVDVYVKWEHENSGC